MKYRHDCDACKPLGEFHDHDLYFCGSERLLGPTLVARYGNNPPDYQSGLTFVGHIPAITEAYKRAVGAGYLKS